MKTSDLFADRVVFSFEIYPAKKTAPIEVVYEAVDRLSRLAPDYISVTYGAGGGAATAANTVEIASLVRNRYDTPAVAHLPGINLTRADVTSLLSRLRAHRIENILALRGDRPQPVIASPSRQSSQLSSLASNPIAPEETPIGEFVHASDLAAFVSAQPGEPFNIIGACYPEVHTEATGAKADLDALRVKVESGVTQLITQLFFDNAVFWRFIERLRATGISVPVQAGIMPVTSIAQVRHIQELTGAGQPSAFRKMCERYAHDERSFAQAGREYAIAQIAELIEAGVEGIHLYTMNNPQTATTITQAIYPLIRK